MYSQTAVVIPCFKVKKKIKDVIDHSIKYAKYVIVVDDNCPQRTGYYVKKIYKNKKNLQIIFIKKNLGVGGATIAGLKWVLNNTKTKYLFKIDGDGQMEQKFIPIMRKYLLLKYDYVKGNRFQNYEFLKKMPFFRIFGNILYSLLSKVSSGYYNIGDVHNGFIGIKSQICKKLIKNNISKRFFFEPDILFHLYKYSARIKELSMPAVYKDEESNINYFSAITLFPIYYIKNFFKRILLVNILKELSFISILFLPSLLFFFHSLAFLYFNHKYFKSLGKETPNGVIMLGFMELLISLQIIILFFIFDYLKSKRISS